MVCNQKQKRQPETRFSTLRVALRYTPLVTQIKDLDKGARLPEIKIKHYFT